MSAAARWRRQLEAWALPAYLLAAVDDSPYRWTKQVWQRKGQRGLAADSGTPTTAIVKDLAGDAGSVLDIGAGTGRSSFPLVLRGHPVTMVEPNPTMLSALRELVADQAVEIVVGRWPNVAGKIQTHQVVMSAHVVYDVADVVPFLRAMDDKAAAGVVIEMTSDHPWAHLRELYLEFHQLERPAGPTTEDLVSVVAALGREPELERWSRRSDMVYESTDEIVEITARRLVLPPARWPELAERLAPRIVGGPGDYQLGPLEREITTLWWRTADSL
ncbi:MAG: class I SAM-dependent methyltransferase [Acidimicrobiia bacterium]